MVPQTGCLLATLLDNSTYYRPLRQLLQHRANAASQTSSCSSSLYPSWWSYRPHHAFVHASDIHNGTSENSSTVLRDILVYAPSFCTFSSSYVQSCHWMLCSRYRRARVAFRWKIFLESLPWIPRLALGADRWWTVSIREDISGDSRSQANGDYQSCQTSVW